jgi:hypothetical protein
VVSVVVSLHRTGGTAGGQRFCRDGFCPHRDQSRPSRAITTRATTRAGWSIGAACMVSPLIGRAATGAELAAKVEVAEKRLHR